jgi:hypothetical protein
MKSTFDHQGSNGSPAARPGLSVPVAVARQLERRLDVDVSSVRIHPESPAAGRLGCRAFACGSDLFFAPGKYRPDTLPGLRLLGHEIAHVAQQARGRVGNPFERGITAVVDPDLEAEADAVGAWLAGLPQVVRGRAGDRRAFRLGDSFAPPAWAGAPCVVQMDDDEDDDEEEDQLINGYAPLTEIDDYSVNAPSGAKDVKGEGQRIRDFNKAMGTIESIGSIGVSVGGQVANVIAGTGGAGLIATKVGLTALLSTALPAATVAATAAAPILGPAGLALMAVEITMSAVALASSYRHQSNLGAIALKYRKHPKVQPGTLEAIAFAVKKKCKKMKRCGVGLIPFLGSTMNSVYTFGRTIKKRRSGKKGVDRRFHAIRLWTNHLLRDPAATEACAELLGDKVFAKVAPYRDGFVLLKKKMRSL